MKEARQDIHPAAVENAKFYLKQYAEKIADKIILLKENIAFDKKVYTSRNCGADKYGQVLLERIAEKEHRLELDTLTLKSIDITINNL